MPNKFKKIIKIGGCLGFQGSDFRYSCTNFSKGVCILLPPLSEVVEILEAFYMLSN